MSLDNSFICHSNSVIFVFMFLSIYEFEWRKCLIAQNLMLCVAYIVILLLF